MSAIDDATSRVGTLVGRDADLLVLQAFVDDAASHGVAFLVTGEPGMGKSTLLEAVAQMAAAAGVGVIRAGGTEFAASVSFAALDHVLTPQHSNVMDLRPPYRQALQVALGMSDGPTPQPLMMANATLELLSQGTSAQPTMIVVDDLQWVDRASVQVLAIMARRLAGTSVSFIGASRPSLPAEFATAGLIEHPLVPLDDSAAEALMRARYPTLAEPTLKRVILEAQGNPLALIELPVPLTAAQVTAVAPLPPVLPVTQRLAAMFSSRLSGLPGHSRQILLLAALEGSGHLASLGRAAEQFGGLDQLAPAEEAGLVLVDESHRTLTFRHPLARATVVAQSTDIERRRAHRTWAGIFTGEADRRAWHLAHACVHADEGVAELLEAVGHTSLKRGDAQGAITALTRAADLSAVRTERGRRLIEAAYVSAVVTGQLANAASLLDAAREVDPTATESLRAAITAANLLFNSECDVDAAHQVLVGALLRYADGYSASDATVVDAMHSLFMICWYASRPPLWEPFNEILRQIEPEPPALLALSARMLGDPVYQAATWLTRLDASAASVRRDSDPVTITRTAIASIYIDRVGGLRDALWRAIRDGRSTGAVPLSISAMVSSCVDDWLTGQWDEALELAEEGVRLSRQHGYRRFTEILGGYIRPLILVVRGAADALAEAEDMAGWADQQGIGMATTFAHHVQTLSAIGSGDFEAAFRHATAISPAGSLPRYTPHALWMLLDVVESGVRSGRPADAAAHVAAMRKANVATISPRLALVVAGAAAIAADGDEATQLYEHALTLPRTDRWPFDLARITLCFGEHLRRQNDASEARAHLRTAAGIFEQLKAEPWATRAKNELRASGVLRPTATSPAADLTPQELEIAQLAAHGLSNKEIAGRLYVSHRTVGARLYRVFPKLGVTTRAGLRDALDAWSAGSEASPPSPSTATIIDSARSLGPQ